MKMRSCLSVLILLAVASAAAAQTAPPPLSAVSAPDAGGSYYQYLLGLHLEMAGDSEGAAAAYERAEKLDPASAEIPAALAALYARLNKPAEAVAAGERAIKADPANPEANWKIGRAHV